MVGPRQLGAAGHTKGSSMPCHGRGAALCQRALRLQTSAGSPHSLGQSRVPQLSWVLLVPSVGSAGWSQQCQRCCCGRGAGTAWSWGWTEAFSALTEPFTAVPLLGYAVAVWEQGLLLGLTLCPVLVEIQLSGFHCYRFTSAQVFVVSSPFQLHWPEKDAGAAARESSSQCHESGGS